MQFYGFHGVFPEENRLGQRFMVDLVVDVDLKKAGQSDNLNESINYGELYQLCKDVVEGEPYKLVESVAEEIASRCLRGFSKARAVKVKVIKPDPPIQGHYESVAVEIMRSRSN